MKNMVLQVLSSGCDTLDLLMNGGLPVGAPSLIFGIPNLGKTWMCFQFACQCTRSVAKGGLGRPSLYLDTESFFTPDVFERIYSYFRRRWPDLPKEPMVEVIRIKDIFQLGNIFGMEMVIKQEESRVSAMVKFPTGRQIKIADTKARKSGGSREIKKTLQSSAWQKNSEIWKKYEEKNYGFLVMDSITIPVKSVIPKGTQHLPGRGSLLAPLLGALYPLTINFKSAALVTDHITRSPLSPTYRYGYGNPWGGDDVKYYIKYQFGLFPGLKADRESMDEGHRIRRVQRYRYPGLDGTMSSIYLGKNQGYIDIPAGRTRDL